MGFRGYVQIRPPEYGSCIAGEVQTVFRLFLCIEGLEVSTSEGDSYESEHWTIEIPRKQRKSKRSKNGLVWTTEYGAITRLAAKMRRHPECVISEFSNSKWGDRCAQLLEEGVEAAQMYDRDTIEIEWW